MGSSSRKEAPDLNPISLYQACTLCPRRCRANRLAGQLGFCQSTADLFCARASLHHWEEPCLSGTGGSGTVFFSGCNLRCVYCQNRRISRSAAGKRIDAERLSKIFLSLQRRGAENINLVTPTHFIPHLLIAIPLARECGLKLPIVYNCGGYESVESLRLLEGLIDVYMPDFKYCDDSLSAELSAAEDYPRIARAAIREMVRQVGAPRFDERGMLIRGVLVRHLVLPGRGCDAIEIARDLFATYGNRILLSVMNQYTPPEGVSLPPFLRLPLKEEEYLNVLEEIDRMGMVSIFAQEGGTVDESFIPDFNGEGV